MKAETDGYVKEITADKIGVAAMQLGAGRATKEDEIDLAVGLILEKKIGDYVTKGDTLVTLHASKSDVKEVERIVLDSYTIVNEETGKPTLIHKEIHAE